MNEQYDMYVSCSCGNKIVITTTHFAGGDNDEDYVGVRCDRCGKVLVLAVENRETVRLEGAKRT